MNKTKGRFCDNYRCYFHGNQFICYDDADSIHYSPRPPLTLHDPGRVPEKEYTVLEVKRFTYVDPKERFEFHLCETCNDAVRMVKGL